MTWDEDDGKRTGTSESMRKRAHFVRMNSKFVEKGSSNICHVP